MSKRPKTITRISNGGSDGNTDGFCGERLVVHRAFSTCKAKDVEKADIHHKCGQPHDAEFGNLAIQIAYR